MMDRTIDTLSPYNRLLTIMLQSTSAAWTAASPAIFGAKLNLNDSAPSLVYLLAFGTLHDGRL